MFTETKVIKQITILPQSDTVQVQWANQIKKDDVVISETFERKAYDATLAGFNTEVGSLDVNAFLAAFNAAALDEKNEAILTLTDAQASLATANSALLAEQTAHTATKALLTAAQGAHTDLANAQAQIATLEAQVAALTPPPAPTFITVTARQIRLALSQAGLREAVEAGVAAGGQQLSDWYEYSNEFEENNQHVVAMASALGVSDQSLHDLFLLAQTL